MSTQIPTGFSEQYTTEVQLLLQQEPSRFRTAVMSRNYTGKSAKAVEQIGAVTAQKRTTRHADTPLIDTPHDARWVFPVDYEWADLIDEQDELRAIADFEGPYVQNGAAAQNRAIDDEIIAAFFSDTTKTGEDAGTTTTWTAFVAANAAHQIAHGSAGLTVAKLISAKQALMAAEVDVDRERLYVGLSSAAHADLLAETETTSVDYNMSRVLVDGRIRSFMGFNFIQSERLPNDGTTWNLPCWAESGMHLGVWGDVVGRVSEREDKSYATQVYTKSTIGATRVEEKKIVEIQIQ